MKKMKSNLIPITRIYDIYPKYAYSNDVKKFMDEIVDIDRTDVFTKSDMVNILDKIRAEIEPKCDRINSLASVLPYTAHREIQELLCEIMDLCKTESEVEE